MEKIIRREIIDPARKAVQEAVARLAENDYERLLTDYEQDHRSFGGRYICADLFKEMFEPYRESPESRNLYNNCVHNTAAVLAAEQFKRKMVPESEHAGDMVILLTGIPGAGKTSSILSGGLLPDNIHAVFEGQLSRVETTIPKIQQILDAGFQPVIVAVHALPERALENTLQRFREEGRGASVGIMSEIQGGLPDGLCEIQRHFGDAVQLKIMDSRDWLDRKTLVGWEHVEVLRSEGSREQIRKRLEQSLEQYRSAGGISEECYRQASGAAPNTVGRDGMVARSGVQHESNGSGRGIPENDCEKPVLTQGEPMPITSGTHCGKVVKILDNVVVQGVGRGQEVAHSREIFAVMPQIGELLDVVYRDGRGTVFRAPEKDSGLGR